jgi:hypothetical protein
VRSLPLTDALINTVRPNIPQIHRLVRRALQPAAATPTPSASAGRTPMPKPSGSTATEDVDQVC